MSIFDGLDKLITEHGSATILRERLSQAKDQYSILERENSTLKTERASLQKNHEDAKMKIATLENEKKELQDKITSLETPSTGMDFSQLEAPKLPDMLTD